jgi:hypothetical protein
VAQGGEARIAAKQPAILVRGLAPAAIIVAGAVAGLWLNLPGHLSYDSVVQLAEGRAGLYSGEHPPVMSWLLGAADRLWPGGGAFVALDVALIDGALLAFVLLAGPRTWLIPATLALACMATPQLAIYPAIVWKDVLFAGAMLAGFACLAGAARTWPRPGWRWPLLAGALALLVLATLTRQNGVVVLPWAAFAVGWFAAGSGRAVRRGLVAGLGFLAAGVGLAAATTLALDTRLAVGGEGVGQQWESLQVYDVTGMIVRDPRIELPVLRARAPGIEALLRGDGARLYAPDRVDHLDPVVDRIEDDDDNAALIAAQWRQLIVRRPLLYLRARGAAFGWVLLTPEPAQCVMVYTGVQGPAKAMAGAGLAFRRTAHDDALADYALRLDRSPISSHAFYGAVAVALLAWLLWRRRPADIAVAAMLAGALTFAASFAVISIACDYRYLYPLDMAAIAGALYAAASRISAGGKGRLSRPQSPAQPFRRQVEEGARLLWQQALAGVDQLDGQGGGLEGRQHDRQRPGRHRLGGLVGEHSGHPDAGGRCVDRGLRRGHRQARLHRRRGARARRLEGPAAGAQALEADAGKPRQVGRRLRLAVAGDEVRTGADYPPHEAHPRRHQAAVGQRADPHRHVDVRVDQVDVAVGERESHVDLRVAGQALDHDRQHVQAAEGDRCGHDQLAAGRGVFPGRGPLGLGHLLQDAPAGRHIGLAGVGERQLAGGAHQQPRAEPRFQLGNLAADCRQRRAEPASRSGETAALHGRHQNGHGFQSVHRLSQFMRGHLPSYPDYAVKARGLAIRASGRPPTRERRHALWIPRHRRHAEREGGPGRQWRGRPLGAVGFRPRLRSLHGG